MIQSNTPPAGNNPIGSINFSPYGNGSNSSSPCPTCGHCPTCGRGGWTNTWPTYPNGPMTTPGISWPGTATSQTSPSLSASQVAQDFNCGSPTCTICPVSNSSLNAQNCTSDKSSTVGATRIAKEALELATELIRGEELSDSLDEISTKDCDCTDCKVGRGMI